MNFTSSAIPDLTKFAKICFDQERLGDAASTIYVREQLRKGTKYLLPHHGRVGVERITSEIFKFVRAPYPITIFEFSTTGELSEKATRETDERYGKPTTRVVGSSKRIIVVLEGTSKEFRSLFGEAVDGIAVIPVSYFDDMDMWCPSPIATIVPRENVVEIIGKDNMSFRSRVYPILPQLIDTLVKEHGTQVLNDLRRDVQEEVTVTVGALIALNCRNVKHVAVTPSPKLNKKREKAGKTPFFEYRILDIFLPGRNLPSGGGRRATAIRSALQQQTEMKLRAVAGHFKHRKTGIFWWKDHMRGTVDAGVIVKDYSVKKPR